MKLFDQGHDFYVDCGSEIDEFKVELDYHNGPACQVCHGRWCIHCEPGIYNETCPGEVG